ncbi:hypothetical protein D3C79_1048930 [compost metagenome]
MRMQGQGLARQLGTVHVRQADVQHQGIETRLRFKQGKGFLGIGRFAHLMP